LDSTSQFQQKNDPVLETSYRIAFRISELIKPHTMGENLMKSCVSETVRLVYGKQYTKKWITHHFQAAPSEISEDILDQVVAEMEDSSYFALRLDESTDVACCEQILV
jgi:hypothetical protein